RHHEQRDHHLAADLRPVRSREAPHPAGQPADPRPFGADVARTAAPDRIHAGADPVLDLPRVHRQRDPWRGRLRDQLRRPGQLHRRLHRGGFWNSVALTIVFTVVSAVIGQNILGMILALLMERANRVITFLVTSIVIGCWILPEVVAGYLLYTFFADEGSLNTILGAIGLPPQDLLFSAPIIAVAFANIWRGTA